MSNQYTKERHYTIVPLLSAVETQDLINELVGRGYKVFEKDKVKRFSASIEMDAVYLNVSKHVLGDIIATSVSRLVTNLCQMIVNSKLIYLTRTTLIDRSAERMRAEIIVIDQSEISK